MSLIFTIVVLTLAVATFSYFWNRVLEFLNATVRDLIEKAFGKTWSDKFADLLIWLDKGAVLVKQTAEAAYEWFRQKVPMMRTKYKIAPDRRTAIKTTTVLVKLSPDTAQETTIEEEVDWHKLPDSVREDAIRTKADSAVLDDMAVVDRQYQEQLKMAH